MRSLLLLAALASAPALAEDPAEPEVKTEKGPKIKVKRQDPAQQVQQIWGGKMLTETSQQTEKLGPTKPVDKTNAGLITFNEEVIRGEVQTPNASIIITRAEVDRILNTDNWNNPTEPSVDKIIRDSKDAPL